MTIARLRISAPQSPYRVCDIAVLETDPTTPIRVICTDADTELIVGSPSIAVGRRDSQRSVNGGEMIRLIGGTYRLVSIAVEMGARDLARQSRSDI